VRLLIDENLSPDLAELARQRGLHSQHVNEVGLNGAGDPILMKQILQHDWILVTNNGQEFLARYQSKAPLHAGLIILAAANGRAEQRASFEAVLRYLRTGLPDPMNMAIVVERDGDEVSIRAYEWPTPTAS
jgi:predicted nuclease of predicted toxin-antitoxin system